MFGMTRQIDNKPVSTVADRPGSALTLAVLLLASVLFVVFSVGGVPALDPFVMPPKATQLLLSEYPALWTSSLVHFTIGHLLSNGLLWWFLARPLEAGDRAGLLLLIVVAPPVSNYLEWQVNGDQFGGLSGLVYAVLAYRLVITRWGSQRVGAVDPILVTLLLLALPLAATGLFGKYANYAHVGGLICGTLLGFAGTAWSGLKR